MIENIKIVDVETHQEIRNKFIQYLDKVPWRAGPYLGNMIRNHYQKGYDRTYALFVDNQLSGFCNLTSEDCIVSQYEPWIGFVYVDEKNQGHRLSETLINHCIEYAKQINFDYIYLASNEVGLYEKYGFEKVEVALNKFGESEQIFRKSIV